VERPHLVDACGEPLLERLELTLGNHVLKPAT
jgi:hypothetical protein